MGRDKKSTIITRGTKYFAIEIDASYTEICNFTINGGIFFSNYNKIYRNIICNSFVGVGITSEFGISNYNKIYENIISNNDCGLYTLLGGRFNQVYFNQIYNNTKWGIVVSGSFNSIVNNDIKNNGEGVVIGLAFFTAVKRNNFIDNKRDAEFFDCIRTHWVRNYWDRFRIGPKIILGSIELPTIPWQGGDDWVFLFPCVNFDLRPARSPYNITIE